MKSLSWLVGILLLGCATQSNAQRETFDVISFVSPDGWERSAVKDAITFRKYNEGRTGYCMISVFDSRPGTDDLQKEFQLEWDDLIKKNQHIDLPAERKVVKGTNGWNAVIGDAVSSTSPPFVAMLLSMVGFGKVASVLVYISDDQFEAEVEKFWTNMQMVENVPSQTPTQIPTGTASSVLATGKGVGSLEGLWKSGCNDRTDINTVTNLSGTGYSYYSISTGGLRVRHMAFLENGIVNSFIGSHGFANIPTERPKDPNIWGIYQYENGKGTIKFDGGTSTYSFVFQNGKIQYDGCVFEHLPWVEDLKLNATYTWETDPAKYKANGMNAEPTIRFTPDGRFSDIGAVYYLNHIKHGYNTDYSDNKYGDGRYEIKHYTLSLFFDDGRIYHYTYENLDGNVYNPAQISVGLKYLTIK